MMGLGERIRQRRVELGLSQRELASEGVSYAYISRIEADARRPSIRALRKLAPKLDVSVQVARNRRRRSRRAARTDRPRTPRSRSTATGNCPSTQSSQQRALTAKTSPP